jgi:hypothetical protein
VNRMAMTVAFAVLCAGCPPPVTPSPSLPTCQELQQRLVSVGCTPEAPKTGTWADVCENAFRHGLGHSYDCVATVTTRAEADACDVGCQP